MYTYCLFCETVKCRYIAAEVRDMLACRTISPKQVQHTWKDGRMTDRLRDLLPGYLFLYSEEPMDITACRYIPGVFRCLRTTDLRYDLSGSDAAFALMLHEKDGIIGKTRVYEENQKFRLTEGAFAGLEAKILKVDRRASRMQIEIPFAHRQVRTWIEYEIANENSTANDTAPETRQHAQVSLNTEMPKTEKHNELKPT